jgi:predicted nucleotide-binding protein (sugar kinase/HSP70/actin superfamily)
VKERIFTLPLCGNYWIPFKGAAEQLGLKIVIPPPITNETIALGARYSPEGICLPFKVIIGNYLQVLDQGANTIVFYINNQAGSKTHGGGGGGMCRFRHYGHLQQLVMERIGKQVEFFILGEGTGLVQQIKEMTGRGTWDVIRALRVAIKKLRLVEIMEEISWRSRAIESHRDATSKALKKGLKALENIKDFKELERLDPGSFFAHIETVDREPLRIGVVGEFYLLVEPTSNCHVYEMLGELGAEVHKHLSLSEAILRYPPGFVLGRLMAWWLNVSIPPRSETAKVAQPYLTCSVAGHGRESVADTIRFYQAGYDGVLHLLPMGCMPEVTVRPILRRISEDYNFPVLTLSFDELINEGAIRTRIETFVDVIRLRRERGEGRDALPGSRRGKRLGQVRASRPAEESR